MSGIDAGELPSVHAGGDHHAVAGARAVDQGDGDVHSDPAEVGPHGATDLGAGDTVQRADGDD